MTEKNETICDALGLENRNPKQAEEMAKVLHKLVTVKDYTYDQAIMDMFAIYHISDNKDTRKIAAEIFTLALSYMELFTSLK